MTIYAKYTSFNIFSLILTTIFGFLLFDTLSTYSGAELIKFRIIYTIAFVIFVIIKCIINTYFENRISELENPESEVEELKDSEDGNLKNKEDNESLKNDEFTKSKQRKIKKI